MTIYDIRPDLFRHTILCKNVMEPSPMCFNLRSGDFPMVTKVSVLLD